MSTTTTAHGWNADVKRLEMALGGSIPRTDQAQAAVAQLLEADRKAGRRPGLFDAPAPVLCHRFNRAQYAARWAEHRQMKRWGTGLEMPHGVEETTPEDLVQRQQVRAALVKALEAIKQADKEILLKPVTESARSLGVPEGTVKSRRSAARRRVLAILLTAGLIGALVVALVRRSPGVGPSIPAEADLYAELPAGEIKVTNGSAPAGPQVGSYVCPDARLVVDRLAASYEDVAWTAEGDDLVVRFRADGAAIELRFSKRYATEPACGAVPFRRRLVSGQPADVLDREIVEALEPQKGAP